jgi:predicted TIM-barrel fold metal-dependent hydrolase
MSAGSRRSSRREFVAMCGGGLSALISKQTSFASAVVAGRVQTPGAVPRIDVHHHILPPEYVRLVGKAAIARPGPTGVAPEWDVTRSLKVMDDAGVSTSIVSVSSPGLQVQTETEAIALARTCNEFAARMVADYRGRFGFFVVVPMTTPAASLTETAYALDVLKADGVGLMTNYGDRYLGDPRFVPLFEELNRRRAVVYVHPDSCSCDLDLLREIPAATIEFPHSTTRTVVSLLTSNTFSRFPDVRFIFSHAGGTIPFLANRIVRGASLSGKTGWQDQLQRLYYDTASSANLSAFQPLLRLVTSKQILLGTDFPFAPAEAFKAGVGDLNSLGLTDDQRRDIEAGNALRLFPRLAA